MIFPPCFLSFISGIVPGPVINTYIIVAAAGALATIVIILVIIIVIVILIWRRKLKSRKRGKVYSVQQFTDSYTQWQSSDCLTQQSYPSRGTVL